jgi:hypothetical protein
MVPAPANLALAVGYSISQSNDCFVGFAWSVRLYRLRFVFAYSID